MNDLDEYHDGGENNARQGEIDCFFKNGGIGQKHPIGGNYKEHQGDSKKDI